MSNVALDEIVDHTWCLNNGASHHMSPSIEQFYDAKPYTGMTSIIIGDGKTLHISHIGTIKLNTEFGLIILQNTFMCTLYEENFDFNSVFK